ncbi:hypothetical protein DWV55_13110 [Butyricicoccus sp. AF10-3]|nr:hypothetical protein DWV55_13110 [Butyricicoccus sp. AF10-3]
MAGKLLDTAPADRHLLILLTDASPDDSRKILPTGKVPLSRSYDGEAGVQDTAEEVRALRQQASGSLPSLWARTPAPPMHGRSMGRIWSVSNGWTSLPPLPENSFRRRFGNCPGEHVQVYCKSYHFSLQPT